MENLLENDIIGSIGTQKYFVQIEWRNGIFIMDEPKKIEGPDLGPDPYTTLLAALAGCTLSTLRMYINRKEWDIPSFKVSLNMYQEQNPVRTIIKRNIVFSNKIEDTIKQRLLVIAGKCPVSKILENSITIDTKI